MTKEDVFYEEKFKIRASEIDQDQEATLPSICNLLQEIAGNHARLLHFDITDLQRDKRTWVLHRLNVSMDRYPEWRETITIRSWPSSGDGLRAYRDFHILGEDGEIIGKSLSYWLIMNMESRRPTRIPEDILAMAPSETDHVLPVDDGDFSSFESAGKKQTFRVRKSDLDLNRHVNNVRYIEWALASRPENPKASSIDIKFMAEAMRGEKIRAELKQETSQKSNKYQHQIKRISDNKILALARSS